MKEKISALQLLTIVILAPFGSAILFFINPDAKQDAWISMLIYIIPGIILQIIYTSLWKKYPEDTLVTYMPKIFGKVIGYPLSIIYIVFFAYEASRIIRDFAELILISMMPREHIILVSIVLTIVVAFTLYLGMETLCRIGLIFFWLWIFFFTIEWFFLYRTPDALHPSNIRPILENGVVPIIKNSWKLITYPYGETILSVMFLPYVVERSKVRKAVIMAVIVEGILLSLNTILFISVLGIKYASTSLFPLLQTLRIMGIGETFDRVDIVIMLIITSIGFLKVSYFSYASMIGIAQLLKIKETRKLAIPFSIIILITSLLIARNYPQHIYIGQVLTLTYVHLPLAVIIPIITLLVYYIKRYVTKRKKLYLK
ncbi:MAG: GerAB/ArcD/ProY family transporter [Clostridiaceae bacterium]